MGLHKNTYNNLNQPNQGGVQHIPQKQRYRLRLRLQNALLSLNVCLVTLLWRLNEVTNTQFWSLFSFVLISRIKFYASATFAFLAEYDSPTQSRQKWFRGWDSCGFQARRKSWRHTSVTVASKQAFLLATIWKDFSRVESKQLKKNRWSR